jgi:hypothetical protein
METLSSKSQKLLLTRDFLKYLLTSNTGCIAYKSYTSAAKCNSLTQLHSITSGKTKKIGTNGIIFIVSVLLWTFQSTYHRVATREPFLCKIN